MKFTLNTNRVVNIVIILVVIILVGGFYLSTFTAVASLGGEYNSYTINDLSKQIDPPISTDLPYDKYITLKEKTQKVRDLKNGDWMHGSGVQFGSVIGTINARLCETCTIANDTIDMPGKEQYYLTLPGWKLKQNRDQLAGIDSTRFYVENGQSFVRKPVIDHAKKTRDGWHYTTHFKDIPVKFRYSREGNYVMIPVSASTKQICSYLLYGVAILLIGCFFFLIAEFLKFVISLSKGLAFTTRNIWRLRLIGFGLIGYPVIMLLLTLLMRVIFSGYLTSDITFNIGTFTDTWPALCAGIVFLLLFKAFRQGMMLKEENDLTV